MPPLPDEKLESHQRWLQRLARRMARSPVTAEDLVQETYLTALNKPPPDGPLGPWLLGMMRKLAWREVRSGRRRVRREEHFHQTGPTVAEPDPLLTYGIDRVRLRASVERLPEPFRSTVEQRFLEGLSCVEIARAAGVPAGTIRWRQSRALELLRTELERAPRPRARRGLVWLPLVGLERTAALGKRVLGLSGRGRSGLALLAVPLVVALTALVGGDLPAGREPTAEARARGPSVRAGRDMAVLDETARAAANEAILANAPRRRVGGDETATRGPVWGDDDSLSESMPSLFEVAPDALARDLYDCSDEDGELDCVRQSFADQPGAPVCLILDRSLGALDRARSPGGRSRHDGAFLRAARLANLLLAAELGCALAAEPEQEEKRGGGATGRTPEPPCHSEEDESGRSCTICTDEGGVVTRACAPVECQTATRRDGSPCLSCTDANGQVESDCEMESGGCESAMLALDPFANEILPILSGELDLNDPDGQPGPGCARGPCHGLPRTDGFHLDVTDTPESNLERFACFVDLRRPERSQILLCATNDMGCASNPHPGPSVFTGLDDLNYQRILAYIRATGP